jgi:hypothetical protein
MALSVYTILQALRLQTSKLEQQHADLEHKYEEAAHERDEIYSKFESTVRSV